MNKTPTSIGRIRRLNQRQQKKLYVGAFQELGFQINARFNAPLDEAAYDQFIDAFLAFIEDRGLCIGGMGGTLPLTETDGYIARYGRGSANDADRDALVNWLQARNEVKEALADPLKDAWHGWK